MTTLPKTSPFPPLAQVAPEVLVDADWLEANLTGPECAGG